MRFVIKYQGSFNWVSSSLQDTKLEDLYFEESVISHRETHIEYGAIIDPDGIPRVTREITHTYKPSFEEWCEEGIDHQQEDRMIDGEMKRFTRKIRKQYLTKEYITLNVLIDDIYKYRCSIYFSKILNEWVLSLGLDEDEFDYEDEYDEE